jgi:hypothetical protein
MRGDNWTNMTLSASNISRQLETQSGSWRFAGHETFPFRYGWLKKAVDALGSDELDGDPNLFGKDYAIVKLGVGKNMVQSIRHWSLATQIVEEKARNYLKVSYLGKKLFSEWDPYLEDPASLWLIHWLLATNRTRASAWYLIFNKFPRPDFTKGKLLEFLSDFTLRNNIKVKDTTLNRDIDCFLRTYLPSVREKALLEDSFNCPLTELDLIQLLHDTESYQFVIGPKPTLPVEIFGYTLFEYILKVHQFRQTISLSDCLYGEGSPGQVFKLNENALVDYIESLQEITSGQIEVDDTSGLKQIYCRSNLTPESCLNSYYEQRDCE